METPRPRRTLVFRLSSLGDVVLASSVLHPEVLPGPVDWVVAGEFAELLKGHPAIGRLWIFDRSGGASLSDWKRLCDELIAQEYDDVIDLHGSLRTRYAKLRFWWKARRFPRWGTIDKQRLRLASFFVFKRLWPRRWRPDPYLTRFAAVVSRAAAAKSVARGTDLSHLATPARVRDLQRATGLIPGDYYGVMPSSRWDGKKWPWRRYLEVVKALGAHAGTPLILGTARDPESVALAGALQAEGIPCFFPGERGVAGGLAELAALLAGARFYLGNDTGLGHLTEAMGRPSHVVFGPTSPEMGFGPWRPRSEALQAPVFCNPCSKDGRRCPRFWSPYRCMTDLSAPTVATRLKASP